MFFKKKNPKAEKGTLTLLFVNLQNYVGMSEKITPEQVVEFLRSYINRCDQIISEHGGLITRIEADRILAVWADTQNLKLDIHKSYQAAIELVQKFSALDYSFNNIIFKGLSVFISLSCGECLYIKEKDKFVEIIGDAVVRVEKINGAEYQLANTIIVDESIKLAYPNFKYTQLSETEKVYSIDGI